MITAATLSALCAARRTPVVSPVVDRARRRVGVVSPDGSTIDETRGCGVACHGAG